MSRAKMRRIRRERFYNVCFLMFLFSISLLIGMEALMEVLWNSY